MFLYREVGGSYWAFSVKDPHNTEIERAETLASPPESQSPH